MKTTTEKMTAAQFREFVRNVAIGLVAIGESGHDATTATIAGIEFGITYDTIRKYGVECVRIAISANVSGRELFGYAEQCFSRHEEFAPMMWSNIYGGKSIGWGLDDYTKAGAVACVIRRIVEVAAEAN